MFEISFEMLAADSPPEVVQELSEMAILTFTDTFRHYKKADIDHYIEHSLSPQQMATELKDPANGFYFVRLNGKRVGFLKWIFPSTVYLEHARIGTKDPFLLQRFYFLPEYCGKGLADVAMAFVTSYAKHQAKADYLYLSVWEKNYRAQRFYQKHGLRTLGSFDYPVGEEIDHEFLMGKQL